MRFINKAFNFFIIITLDCLIYLRQQLFLLKSAIKPDLNHFL